MRKTLLVSVSAIALIAAAGLAGAQEKGMGSGAQAPSGPSQMSPQAEPKAGGEMKGGGAEKGTTGQSSDPRAEPKGPDAFKGEPKSGPVDRSSEPKAAPTSEPKAGTTGQALPDTKGDRQPPAAAPRAQESGKDAPKAGTSQAPADSKSGAGTTGQGAAGGAGAQLTTEQRTQISTTIRQVNVRPEANVNFSVSVGTVIPRNITLHVLPPRVVEIYPAWRGYRFILVGNQIVVIDPASFRIVAVIAV